MNVIILTINFTKIKSKEKPTGHKYLVSIDCMPGACDTSLKTTPTSMEPLF